MAKTGNPDTKSGRTKRGRPRDPSRDRAILDAARKVIALHGYTGATMEQIARRAGVGKDTLYRRWPSKDQLVIDLVASVAEEAVLPKPVDPDPRINLFMFLKDINHFTRSTDFGSVIAGIVGEAARNEELADSFQAFWTRRRAIAAELVVDVVGPDVGPEQIEKLLDNLLAPLYYRLLLTGAETTDKDLWVLVAALPWTTRPEGIEDVDFQTALVPTD